MNIKNPLRMLIESRFLPYVEKPMRYTGGELNIVQKDLSKIKVHGVLCFPDLYDIGMSHFGLQILYHIVNGNPDWALSRCFHPWTDAEQKLRELNIPLYSLEYFTPIRDADWIGFTIQYELQYTNIVNMLDLSGLAVFSKDRKPTDPVVIAGGPCVGNPEPPSRFIDAFAIGDGEITVRRICETFEKLKGEVREKKLEALAKIPGIYIPANYHKCLKGGFVVPETTPEQIVAAEKIPELKSDDCPSASLVPLMDVVHHRLSVEVMRGCTRGCRFCSAGMYYRPVRERIPSEIHDQIRRGIESTGWREVGLLSLSTADYSCLTGLLTAAADLKEKYHLSLSFPSTRVDSLSREQFELVENVSPVSSMTIAPEAATQRLRKVINKDFTDEQIYDTVKKLMTGNVQTLKLYFMIGLPTETQEDIEAMIEMIRKIAGMVRAGSGRKMVNVSLSPFSPKPHTPFQWEKMDEPASLIQKGQTVKYALKALKNVKISYRDPNITLLETISARGDDRVGELIYTAWKNGARFDGWDEHFNIGRWSRAAEKISLDVGAYLDKIPDEQQLPWSAVSIGVTDEFFKKERDRAYKEETTPDCRTSECTICGACGEKVSTFIAHEAEMIKPSSVKESKEKEPVGNYHYRYRFAKDDVLRFLGHLDMITTFHRAFLISGIPLAYSHGYNPHPKLSFGPPLPFGVYGESEAFDLVSTKPLSDDPCFINRWLPKGLRVIERTPISGSIDSLTVSIKAACYRFLPINPIDRKTLEFAVTDLIGREKILFDRKKGDQIKTIDLKPLIRDLKVINHEGGWGIEGRLALSADGTCKPSELLKILFPDKNEMDFAISRMEFCFK